MIPRTVRPILFPVAISLLASGCFVATARFEEKVAESDALRDALAGANREKGVLAGRNDSLQKQLADLKETADSCALKTRSQDAELSRLSSELSSARRSYEGTRITREELITELLEKEKATGKRIQELSGRAQSCEAEGDRLRKEVDRAGKELVARDAQIADLEERLKKAQGDESLRQERDMLLGKIERLVEDRKDEEKRREGRYEALVAKLKEAAPAASASFSGGVLRVGLPEKGLLAAGGTELSETGRAAVAEIAAVLADFPAGRVVLNAQPDGKAMKATAAALEANKVEPGRVVPGSRDRDGALDLLVVVP